MNEISLVRTLSFSAAHRYFNSKLSIAENKAMYGSLMNEEGFGHNFLVEAHMTGEIDPLTGMIVNLVDLDQWLKEISVRFDHQDLNARPEFRDGVPTPERIAQVFGQEMLRLTSAGPDKKTRIRKIRVYEGDSLWVDFYP